MDMRVACGDGSCEADVGGNTSLLSRLSMYQNTLGSIGEHNIVIASLLGGIYGNTSATSVEMQLLSIFHAIRIGFVVGIGGGSTEQ